MSYRLTAKQWDLSILQTKQTKKSNENDSQMIPQRESIRRQIKFDEPQVQDQNNNATKGLFKHAKHVTKVANKKKCNQTVQKGTTEVTSNEVTKVNDPLLRPSVVKSVRTNDKIFDGIQVSLNSDEEELDYVDDVPQAEDFDDEHGSIMDVQPTQTNTKSDLLLGASSASINDENLVMNNPHLKKLFNQMLDERIKQASERGESSSSQLLTTLTPNGATVNKTPEKSSGKTTVNLVKSPSDTTIYAPALQRRNNVVNQNVLPFNVSQIQVPSRPLEPKIDIVSIE